MRGPMSQNRNIWQLKTDFLMVAHTIVSSCRASLFGYALGKAAVDSPRNRRSMPMRVEETEP